jgi:hypothetical protein
VSDLKAVLQIAFISRSTGQRIAAIPAMSQISMNQDMSKFTDVVDFEVTFRFKDRIELQSHDFWELFYIYDNAKFQLGCGFVEDFVKATGNSSLKFQGNGRDFLGQTLKVPFVTSSPVKNASIVNFTRFALGYDLLYVNQYAKFRGISNVVVDNGSYQGPLLIKATSDLMIGSVLQEMSDTCQSMIYQNRHGQVIVYGRENRVDINVPYTLSDVGDPNVKDFTLRENFSKVLSEAKIYYAGAEGNLDYNLTPSRAFKNTEPKAANIFQPHLEVFNQADLVTLDGQYDVNSRKDALAQARIRKSNQFLEQVVIKTSLPFYIPANGGKPVPYEKNQNWRIKSLVHGIDKQMKLAGIGYRQDPSNLDVELNFVGVDTLV